MKPTQAKTKRRSAIQVHCDKLIDQVWPTITQEQAAEVDRLFEFMLAETDRWLAFAERQTDTMPGDDMLSCAAKLQRIYERYNPKANAINAAAKQSIAHLISEHKPRIVPYGIKIKLPAVTLQGEGKKVTIRDLWAFLTSNGKRFMFTVHPARLEGYPPHRHGMCHPHVRSCGTPCMGSVATYYTQAMSSGRFIDAFDMLSDALENYNGSSPYIKLQFFIGEKCPKCGVTEQTLTPARIIQPDGTLATIRRCQNCIKTCQACGQHYLLEDAASIGKNWCVTCGGECSACKQKMPKVRLRNGLCANCSIPCPRCEQRSPATSDWYIVDHGGHRIDYRLRCGHCIQQYPPSHQRQEFDMPAAIKRYGSAAQINTRSIATAIFLEAQNANADGATEPTGGHCVPAVT